jgi:S-DNA-T family DNA segregation ATPase FtsK/SpoIIIE
VILRLADEGSYVLLDAPNDVLSATSPPGRAIVDGLETQIAVVGGSRSVAEQSRAMAALAEAMVRNGRAPAAPIGSLGSEIPASSMPASVGGLPVLGVSDDTLEPVGFDPSGVFLLAGPPASGRSNALSSMVSAVQAVLPEVKRYYIGNSRSPIGAGPGWEASACTLEDVVDLAKELSATVSDAATKGKIMVVIEQIGDFLSSAADSPLVELIKAVKRSDHFLLAESETGQWGSSWPLLAEVKAARTGFLLQPDGIEGETILKTPLPRASRGEFPPGRGYFINRGKAARIQLPLQGA